MSRGFSDPLRQIVSCIFVFDLLVHASTVASNCQSAYGYGPDRMSNFQCKAVSPRSAAHAHLMGLLKQQFNGQKLFFYLFAHQLSTVKITDKSYTQVSVKNNHKSY